MNGKKVKGGHTRHHAGIKNKLAGWDLWQRWIKSHVFSVFVLLAFSTLLCLELKIYIGVSIFFFSCTLDSAAKSRVSSKIHLCKLGVLSYVLRSRLPRTGCIWPCEMDMDRWLPWVIAYAPGSRKEKKKNLGWYGVPVSSAAGCTSSRWSSSLQELYTVQDNHK